MKRKDYQKPTMTVVELRNRTQLLAGSVGAQRSGYGDANNGVDLSELNDDGEWVWN